MPGSAEDKAFRLGAGAIAATLAACAGLAADLAAAHMSQEGMICGAGSQPHCVWCLAAPAFAIGAAIALRLGLGSGPARAARLQPWRAQNL